MEAITTGRKFMVIDDDSTNNYICARNIRVTFPGSDIQTFTAPEEGLDVIMAAGADADDASILLFLDINMPMFNGWDVLEKFATLPEDVRRQFTIYMLSSSISSDDQRKASNNALVSGFIEKPLSVERLRELHELVY